jgi:hypothetical protein
MYQVRGSNEGVANCTQLKCAASAELVLLLLILLLLLLLLLMVMISLLLLPLLPLLLLNLLLLAVVVCNEWKPECHQTVTESRLVEPAAPGAEPDSYAKTATAACQLLGYTSFGSGTQHMVGKSVGPLYFVCVGGSAQQHQDTSYQLRWTHQLRLQHSVDHW